jgi:ubiquinone/menaquinone biosynthesis C-methylase UbiE
MSSSLDNHTPENYNTHAAFVYSTEFSSPVLDLLDARQGESIIDLGCGTGELTAKIKALVGPEGQVFGLDSSRAMVLGSWV